MIDDIEEFLLPRFVSVQEHYLTYTNASLERTKTISRDVNGNRVDFVDSGVQYVWGQWQISARLCFIIVNDLLSKHETKTP